MPARSERGHGPPGATLIAGEQDTSRYDVTVTSYRLVPCPGAVRPGYPRAMGELITCDFCGTQASDEQTLTWTTAVENGRRRTFCDTCSRTHLRAMESKLDSEWW